MRIGTIILIVLLGTLVVIVVFFPSVQGLWFRLNSREVTINLQGASVVDSSDGTRKIRIVNVAGKDAIPAILEPRFLTDSQASDQMSPEEFVLGLSINDDSRAYPLRILSRHEIVNDVVGGVPVAVTW